YNPIQVDATGKYLFIFCNGIGLAFSCQSCRVKRSFLGKQYPVQWYFLARTYLDPLANGHRFRGDGNKVAITKYQGFLGAYVQQSFYVSLGTFNGGTLEQFAYGIEQHHGHPFRIFAQGKCPQSCKGHQEEFRKEITFLNTHPTLFNDGKPYWYIGYRIPNDAGPSIKE